MAWNPQASSGLGSLAGIGNALGQCTGGTYRSQVYEQMARAQEQALMYEQRAAYEAAQRQAMAGFQYSYSLRQFVKPNDIIKVTPPAPPTYHAQLRAEIESWLPALK